MTLLLFVDDMHQGRVFMLRNGDGFVDIVFSRQAEKWLDNHDNKTVCRVYVALKKLPEGDVVRLIGSPDECRLRVGKYRVVFKVSNNRVLVSKIDSRGGVYK